MLKIRYIIATLLISFSTSVAQAEGSGFGLNVGVGLPFIQQVGAHYYINDMFSVSAEYGLLDIDVDEASAELSMPAIMLNFHPMSGSWFIAAGLGQESLEVTAVESVSSNTIKVEVDASTTILKTGWQWGKANGGFWFGIDFSYITPSGADTTITAPGVSTTDPNYLDALEAAEDFGDSSYANVTFARFGWVF